MNILLVAVNARFTHSCLALYCLKSFLAGSGHRITIREFHINQDPDEILQGIAGADAEIIGFSSYIWNARLLRRLLPAVKSATGAVIVVGGPEAGYEPDPWLRAGADFVVRGHGESAFRALLEAGISLPERVICLPNPPFADMPIPYDDDDLAALQGHYLYYESSRGCPFRCAYCLSSREDQRLEMKDPATVEKELEVLLAARPRLLKFVDRTFNADPARGREIWRWLISSHSDGETSFHFEVHPLFLCDEDFRVLEKCPAGLFQFEIGVQTINPQTRAEIHRGGTWERERETIRRIIAQGNIRVHLDLIAGLPGEHMASMEAAINECYQLRPGHFQIGFLKVLPGTQMRERAEDYGIAFDANPPYRVIATPTLNERELHLLDAIAHLVDRLYNRHRFETALALLESRVTHPFALFRAMASHAERAGLPTRDWNDGASFMLSFVDTEMPEAKRSLLDALRWDWCSSGMGHRWPEAVKPRGIEEMRRKALEQIEGMDVSSRRDLKRAIVFVPETDEFRTARMSGADCAVFFPDKRMVPIWMNRNE